MKVADPIKLAVDLKTKSGPVSNTTFVLCRKYT